MWKCVYQFLLYANAYVNNHFVVYYYQKLNKKHVPDLTWWWCILLWTAKKGENMDLNDFKNYYKTNSSGVYALFLNNNGDLSIFDDPAKNIIKTKMVNGLLYIGKASSLSDRIEHCHLRRARVSALRRTIAKLLNMDFITISGKNGLNEEDENTITKWMSENTYFKIYETTDKISAEQLEDELITKYQPPFNKKGCLEHF